MKHLGLFQRLSLKWILKSALTLESRIYGLYKSMLQDLQTEELPDSLAAIIEEEKQHQQVITDIIANRIPADELAAILEKKSFHKLEEILPLNEQTHLELINKIRILQQHEADIFTFYSNLYNKSKIPAVKKVFKYLVDQESIHLKMLERLIGGRPTGV